MFFIAFSEDFLKPILNHFDKNKPSYLQQSVDNFVEISYLFLKSIMSHHLNFLVLHIKILVV